MRALAALLLLVLAGGRLEAAVTVTATIDPAKVAAGESADLAVAIEGTQSAAVPQIGDVGGLSVSYVGPATQMSLVNGRMSTSITHHFTVVGTKPGRYAIGPITVEADGSRHDAGAVAFEVVAASASTGPDAGGGDQVTLELGVPRTEVYLRERIPLAVKLVVGNVHVTDLQYPTTSFTVSGIRSRRYTSVRGTPSSSVI